MRRTASDNLVPPIIAAVEAQATVGEIADTLRGVFGEYRRGQPRLSWNSDRSWSRSSRSRICARCSARVVAVNDVSFEIRKGETLGLVGESGSGKSVTAFSIIRLVQEPGPHRRRHGFCSRAGTCWRCPKSEMRQVRGAGIGFVFQEPMAALNPVMRVGAHIAEALTVHGLASRSRRARRAPSSCCAR